MFHRPILLASGSPRRLDLLQRADFQIRVQTTDVQEDFPPDMPIRNVAEYLADKKAKAAAHLRESNEVLLAADTVVVLDGQLLGKPVDLNDARDFLQRMAGKKHEVITGVCLLDENKEVIFSATSEVWMSPMREEEIDYYIEKYQPLDKAGAYAIQEWIGLCKVERYVGTYSNIMGLPVARVYQTLHQEFSLKS